MRIAPALRTMGLCAALVTQAACGGGSDDAEVTPTGSPLPNLAFIDSDSYFPLDKLKADGSYFVGNEADFGPRNPAYAANNRTESKWAIDTSASVPAGHTLSYSFKVTGVNVGAAEVASLTSNLRIQADTGLITQSCTGFPNCYDNHSAQDHEFQITATASVNGNKGSLSRNFRLRVRANN
ncbi:hypothetical protein [Hydrogenophaga sp.]|uniref:hypothetical protein n=1 Tax=Hydrogenophaga sp. TaxID=1904254 RepID=UPI0025C4EB71|nr:hypothetical protein [Hydrogenophaga sp.]